MGDRPDYEVERGSYWRSVENRRKMLIAASVVVAVLVAAAAVALSASSRGDADPSGEASRTITPAEETTGTTAAVSADEDATGEPVTEPGASQDGADTPTVPYVVAPLVAYRYDGALWVAAEDGSGARAVAASAEGAFSLAPDGSTIAFVDAATGTLALADVASGAVVPVGAAVQDTPSWAPDSAWLVYTAPGPMVMRVLRSGAGAVQLFAGSLPSASVADGSVVAAAASGELAIWRNGSLTLAPTSGTITGLATDGTTVWCGSLTAEGGASLCAGAIAGTGEKRVVIAAPQSNRAVTFSELVLSADGSQLAFAEQGDDGYSRMFAVPSGGGSAIALSVRRDCYPLRWTADSTDVLFIEGNSFQGDPTALMRVASNGGSRRLLIQGAGH